MSPEAFGCCRKFVNGNYCPPDDQPPCCQLDQDSGSCSANGACNNCTTTCTTGVHPQHNLKRNFHGFWMHFHQVIVLKGGSESGIIQASAFRTYHTLLNKQTDYVNSMRAARDFGSRMSKDLQMQNFPYSVFYIFFEQYLSAWKTAIMSIFVCLGYAPAKNDFLFERRLQSFIFNILMQHSRGKSALVFCSTRKGAQEAAQCLSQTAGSLGKSIL